MIVDNNISASKGINLKYISNNSLELLNRLKILKKIPKLLLFLNALATIS
jgi:hypothetical protein